MRILNHALLPLPLVLLLSVQLLGISQASARLEEGVADLPSAQLLTRADTYLATGRGSDALELYDLVAGRDKSSYVGRWSPFNRVPCRRGEHFQADRRPVDVITAQSVQTRYCSPSTRSH